jgi:hypothetical protein
MGRTPQHEVLTPALYPSLPQWTTRWGIAPRPVIWIAKNVPRFADTVYFGLVPIIFSSPGVLRLGTKAIKRVFFCLFCPLRGTKQAKEKDSFLFHSQA